MTNLLLLIPVALFLGLLGLAAFMWALKSGQFEDLDGAAHRILDDDDQPERPAADDENATVEPVARQLRPGPGGDGPEAPDR